MEKRRKLVLVGTNDVEVELDGVELTISGPLESGWTPIDPEGLMPPDEGSEIRGLAQFFRVVGITPRDDGSATLELVRLSKSGRVVGEPTCLEGVSFAGAIELQDRLRGLAEAPAIEVPVERLFAEPERFHGQKLRLEWVGATVKPGGNGLWRCGGGAAPPIWHDLELLPGSYEVVVEGVFRFKAGRGYGPLGRSAGDFTVVDLVDSRPAGETLARLVRERVVDLVRARWRELEPAAAPARHLALSPPFPTAWPPRGGGRLVYYAFSSSADDALGLQLAAGQQLGAIWAAVTVDALGHDAPGLELLAPGEAAGSSAALDEAQQLSEGWLELAGEACFGELFHAARAARDVAPADAALDAARQLYAAWLACYAPVAAPIAARHADFIAWLEGA